MSPQVAIYVVLLLQYPYDLFETVKNRRAMKMPAVPANSVQHTKESYTFLLPPP